MTDVVQRAKDSLNTYEHARAYGCEPQYPEALIRSLLTEVEKLRGVLIDGTVDDYVRENGLTHGPR